MTCYDVGNLIINILIALGTIGAVLTAIFGFRIIRTKLDVLVLNEEGELTNHGEEKPTIYYHLKIVNLRKVSIKNCRVFLKKVEKKQPNGEYIELQMSYSPQYLWTAFKKTDESKDIVTENVLDFGFVEKNSQEFFPAVHPILDIFKGKLKPNESFRYFLEIIADNYRPKKLIIIEVSWDGKWTSNLNEMKSSLIIKRK